MTPPRFRAPALLASPGDHLALGEAAARHAHVLRLAPGDPVVVFDGEGLEGAARVHALDASSLVVELEALHPRALEAHAPVLVQCVPKGSKLDDVVRAATEAGVGEIHLALSSRCVARAEGARLDRLGRIVEEAARQSEAPRVPRILPPAPLLRVAERAPSTSTRLVLSPREGARLRERIGPSASPPWLVVGPEGGLTDDETAALIALGYALARLDTYVLRTEHAGPIAVALARELSG